MACKAVGSLECLCLTFFLAFCSLGFDGDRYEDPSASDEANVLLVTVIQPSCFFSVIYFGGEQIIQMPAKKLPTDNADGPICGYAA